MWPFRKKEPENAGKEQAQTSENSSINMQKMEKYGKAWLMIVGQKEKERGLQMMRELDQAGFIEGTVALSMFTGNSAERRALIKKAADEGNAEGLWEYCSFLPHSYCPDPNNRDDALWEKYCLEAAETGSVDAMNEMGNVFHRRKNYCESMYWYAMANANDHPEGQISMAGIANEWKKAGCPKGLVSGSPKYDISRHTCALTYLEIHAGQKPTASMDELIRMTMDGVPIAGYLAGDIFEGSGNDMMAYKMYNALCFENDAHALKCCADMVFLGKGTAKDQKRAMDLYMLSAANGDRSAMFVVGEFSRANNINVAAYFYGLAHTRGYAPALDRLIQLAK